MVYKRVTNRDYERSSENVDIQPVSDSNENLSKDLQNPRQPSVRERPDLITKAALASLCATGFTLWGAWGVNVGFQVLPIGQLFLYITFILTVAARGGRVSVSQTASPLMAAIIGLTILLFISASYAFEPIDSIRYATRYVQGIILLVIFSSLQLRRAEIQKTMDFFAWGSICAALITIAGIKIPLVHALTVTDPGGRSQGPFNYSNQLGLAMAMAVPLFTWRVFAGRFLYIVPICLLGVALLASGSKTNFLLFGYNLAAYGVLENWTNRRTFKALLWPLAIIALVLLLSGPLIALLNIINPGYVEKIMQFANAPMEQGTTTGRVDIYTAVIKYIFTKSIFGVGAGNEIQVIPLIHAHNVFMDILLCAGLPALAIMIVVIFLVGRVMFSSLALLRSTGEGRHDLGRRMVAICVSLFSYFCSNQVSDSFGANTLPLFWLLLGMQISFIASLKRRTVSTTRRRRRDVNMSPAPAE